ncbi:MAG: hypothetical protein SNH63_00860 [Rikenellaceae bacterium]
MRREIYRVAEHSFSVTMPHDNELWGYMQPFEPFVAEGCTEDELIFEMKLVESIDHHTPIEQLVTWSGSNQQGMVDIAVDRTATGRLLRLIQPTSDEVNATMHITTDGRSVEATLSGALDLELQALNNVLIIGYLAAGAYRKTVLLHSSTVICDGRSYLFLGKSGTGKSTHSREWLEAFPQSRLLNDDHPIVRILDSGEVRTYGSPWSGKCPCYKNDSAPLAGIARIEQAPINEAIILRPVLAYASIATSSSALQWLSEANESKNRTLNEIVERVASIRMRCLPNIDAAEVCKSVLDSITK